MPYLGWVYPPPIEKIKQVVCDPKGGPSVPASRAKPQPLDVRATCGIVRRRTLPGYLRLGRSLPRQKGRGSIAVALFSTLTATIPATAGCAFLGADMADLPEKQTQEIGKGKPGPGRPKGSPTRRQPHSRRPFFKPPPSMARTTPEKTDSGLSAQGRTGRREGVLRPAWPRPAVGRERSGDVQCHHRWR